MLTALIAAQQAVEVVAAECMLKRA